MDPNANSTGGLGDQPVVLAHMPAMGMMRASAVVSNIRFSFRGIESYGFRYSAVNSDPALALSYDSSLVTLLSVM